MQHWIIQDPTLCGAVAGLSKPHDAIFLTLENYSSVDGKEIDPDIFAPDGLTAAVAVMEPDKADTFWRDLTIALRGKVFRETAKEQGYESVIARWKLADGRDVILAADNSFGNQMSDYAMEKIAESELAGTDWVIREGLSAEAGPLPAWLEALAPEKAPAMRR